MNSEAEEVLPHGNACQDRNDSVIVIGGCHVIGWKIGKSPSFWSEISKKWSVNPKVSCYGPTSLKQAVNILINEDISLDGALLILQLGNFESNSLSTAKYFIKKVFSISNKSSYRNADDVNGIEDLTDSFLSKKEQAYLFAKGFISLAAEIITPPNFRKKKLKSAELNIEKVFDEVDRRSPAKVIVFSTFPTANPAINFYRKLLNKSIIKIVSSRNYIYVDVFYHLKYLGREKNLEYRSLFVDGFHLSPIGHSLVGEAASRLIDERR